MSASEDTQGGGGRRAGRDRQPKADRCPICDKPVSAEYLPFCSRRCADVDLSRWLGGKYAIPGEPADDPEDFQG